MYSAGTLEGPGLRFCLFHNGRCTPNQNLLRQEHGGLALAPLALLPSEVTADAIVAYLLLPAIKGTNPLSTVSLFLVFCGACVVDEDIVQAERCAFPLPREPELECPFETPSIDDIGAVCQYVHHLVKARNLANVEKRMSRHTHFLHFPRIQPPEMSTLWDVTFPFLGTYGLFGFKDATEDVVKRLTAMDFVNEAMDPLGYVRIPELNAAVYLPSREMSLSRRCTLRGLDLESQDLQRRCGLGVGWGYEGAPVSAVVKDERSMASACDIFVQYGLHSFDAALIAHWATNCVDVGHPFTVFVSIPASRKDNVAQCVQLREHDVVGLANTLAASSVEIWMTRRPQLVSSSGSDAGKAGGVVQIRGYFILQFECVPNIGGPTWSRQKKKLDGTARS